MKRSGWFTVAAVGLAATLAASEEAKRLELGAKAPKAAVQMEGVDGKRYSIEGVAGKRGTLVMFSCNACPWVKAWEDRIASLGNESMKKDVGVIVINPNDPSVVPEDDFETMKKRAEQRGFEFPYVVDATSEVARAFGATKTPEVFLFDAEGKLVYWGAIDDNAREPEKVTQRYLKDALESVVAGRPVETTETKALGCTIKWRKAEKRDEQRPGDAEG